MPRAHSITAAPRSLMLKNYMFAGIPEWPGEKKTTDARMSNRYVFDILPPAVLVAHEKNRDRVIFGIDLDRWIAT